VTRFRDLPGDTDRTPHPQVHITHGPTSALVDVGIAPLILALWRRGIDTQASCQGDNERAASISFPTGMDADHFVQLVKPWRLACELHPDQHPQNTAWRWCATQLGEDSVYVHVDFPPAELPAVTAAAEQPDMRDFREWLDAEYERQVHAVTTSTVIRSASSAAESSPIEGR
jgi:hypothetical protein